MPARLLKCWSDAIVALYGSSLSGSLSEDAIRQGPPYVTGMPSSTTQLPILQLIGDAPQRAQELDKLPDEKYDGSTMRLGA
jgi:hypothetical protein